MKIKEIREMSSDEISKRIVEAENELVDLRFQNALKQLTNTAKIKNTRKEIARMKTIVSEREIKAVCEKESKKQGDNV